MDFLKKNKIVTIVAGLAILALIYFAFSSLSASPTLSSTDTGPSPISQSLLVTLANLHTIRLDGSIFQNPSFVSLTDFGVVIAPEAVGRRNPFLPAGASATATTTPASGNSKTKKLILPVLH